MYTLTVMLGFHKYFTNINVRVILFQFCLLIETVPCTIHKKRFGSKTQSLFFYLSNTAK